MAPCLAGVTDVKDMVFREAGSSPSVCCRTSTIGATLEVENLTIAYGDLCVVSDVGFHVHSGEVLGLLGPNGAGKTTTFLALSGLVKPRSGSMKYAGTLLDSDRGQLISLLPETPEVYDLLSVWEHVEFVARLARVNAGWATRAEELLARLGLSEIRCKLAGELSKGLKQKLLLACTLLAESKVLMLDEPMVGLDPLAQYELRDLIREMSGDGKIVMISTHQLELALSACDRLLILHKGRVVTEVQQHELEKTPDGLRSLEDIFFRATR